MKENEIRSHPSNMKVPTNEEIVENTNHIKKLIKVMDWINEASDELLNDDGSLRIIELDRTPTKRDLLYEQLQSGEITMEEYISRIMGLPPEAFGEQKPLSGR